MNGMKNKATDTYENRCKGRVAEDLFEEWCKKKDIRFIRSGFDEQKEPMKRYVDVHPTLRSIPDYMVEAKDGKITWVHIKGTGNFKINDLFLYHEFDQNLRGNCKMLVGFCFRGKDPIFKTFKEIQKQLTGKTIKEWDDGKQYIHLDL